MAGRDWIITGGQKDTTNQIQLETLNAKTCPEAFRLSSEPLVHDAAGSSPAAM